MKKYWVFALIQANRIVFLGKTDIGCTDSDIEKIKSYYIRAGFIFNKIKKICRRMSEECAHKILMNKVKNYKYQHKGKLPIYNKQDAEK